VHGVRSVTDVEGMRRFPVLYALLVGKKGSHYDGAISLGTDRLKRAALPLPEADVSADYEHPLRVSVEHNVQESKLGGETFHFGKIIISHVGVSRKVYHASDEIRLAVRTVLVLPFVPVVHVIVAYERVAKPRLSSCGGPDHGPAMDKFMRYFVRRWLANSQRPIEKWSVSSRRWSSTNPLEGWHAHLNDSLRAHPDFFELLSFIQQTDARARLEYEQMQRHQVCLCSVKFVFARNLRAQRLPRRRRQVVQKENAVAQALRRFHSQETTLSRLVDELVLARFPSQKLSLAEEEMFENAQFATPEDDVP